MVWTFPHKEYLRQTSGVAIRQLRSVHAPVSLCLAALDAALTNFPVERDCIRSAINTSRKLGDRLQFLAAHEALRDEASPPVELARPALNTDDATIVDWTCQLLAYKTREIAYWRYLSLVCDLADLSELRPLYEASLADAERFEDWLRRAFETLAVHQLQLAGVLSAAPLPETCRS
jgi:hypothetical protein